MLVHLKLADQDGQGGHVGIGHRPLQVGRHNAGHQDRHAANGRAQQGGGHVHGRRGRRDADGDKHAVQAGRGKGYEEEDEGDKEDGLGRGGELGVLHQVSIAMKQHKDGQNEGQILN